MLVSVMPNVFLRRHECFVLAIIAHSRVAPLEWQHQQNQQGKETSHRQYYARQIWFNRLGAGKLDGDVS